MKILKDKKGFTLTELLATIVILCIIAGIAIPSTLYISGKLKTDMYCTKIKVIENDAKIWGEDNLEKIKDFTNLTCGGRVCDYNDAKNLSNAGVSLTTLRELGYIKEDDVKNGKVINPLTNEEMETDHYLVVYRNNHRVYSKMLKKASDGSKVVIKECE